MGSNFDDVPEVDIDPSGVFKYILIKLHRSEGDPKYIVRGYARHEYHGR